jgi:ribosomal protein L24
MSQSYQADDKVVVISGPDEGRKATVVDNYEGVYGDDMTDGALVRFADGKPSNDTSGGKNGVTREFRSVMLRKA